MEALDIFPVKRYFQLKLNDEKELIDTSNFITDNKCSSYNYLYEKGFFTNMGRDSQNFLHKFVRFFVTLGL